MIYTPIDFMTPVIDFVNQYEDFQETGSISMIPIKETSMQPENNSMAYMGSSRPTRTQDTLGNIFSAKQANFVLYVKRNLVGEYQNQQLANVIHNFEQWVEFMDITKQTPRFSTDPDYNETMWADNGFIWNVVDETGGVIPFVQYQVQLHIQYQLLFESGGY